MKAIFNRDAVTASIAMLAVLAALVIGLHVTSNTEALATCKAERSSDVCEFTLK